MSRTDSGSRARGSIMLTLLLALTVGCTADELTDSDPSGSSGSDAVLLVVSPEATMLSLQGSEPFTATALRRDRTVASVAITWTATGGTIDASGNFTAGSVPGSYRVIGSTETGTLADTSSVSIQGVPSPAPPPNPPAGTSCLDRGAATITLTGDRTSSYDRRSDLPAGTIVDADAASWTLSGTGAGARAGDADAICWHGGTFSNTLSQENSWATFHDTYAFMGYGSNMVVEDLRAHNFGDGIKWVEETSSNWAVRRVHLSDMHDDCVETDWVKGGRIDDVLFEGCFVFLATRPRSALSGSVDGSQETIVVDRAVVWMKPIRNTYNMDPPNSTGAVFKVHDSSDSDSPRMRLRNIVLRVDVEPGSGNACLNPHDLVVESVNNTVIWTGSGDYPCLPLPPGWTMTRDRAVWDAAVADWKARHPGR